MQHEPAIQVGRPRADDALRVERDRFVALAFCSSDILVELDRNLTIMFAAGATAALLGTTPDALVGRSFADLVAAPDRDWIGQRLRSVGTSERIRDISVRLEGAFGETPPMSLVGYQNPDMGHRYYLALQVPGVDAEASRMSASLALTPSGLPDGQTFAETVGSRLVRLGSAAEMHKLTLMRLDGLVQLEDRLEKETRDRLLSQVAGMIRTA
jgi:PAS domain S-box-containing protein